MTEAFLPLLHAAEAGRIVNVSSTMGSLTDQGDPASPYYDSILPAYQASKAAVNSLTISLAKTLAGSTVTVNAICPGWVKTDLGGGGNWEHAPLTADERAQVIVRIAVADGQDAPNGGFFDRAGTVPW